MKKTLFVVLIVSVMALGGLSTLYAQPMDPDPGWGGDWDYCPYCGNHLGPGYGMGPWMMGRGYGGYGMGPWMMGRGYGGYGMMGPGYGYGYGPEYGYGPQSQRYSKPLDQDQAKQQVEDYLKSTKNPNLKIGKIEEKGNDYEVNIETKDGSLADKILISKDTGWMRSAY